MYKQKKNKQIELSLELPFDDGIELEKEPSVEEFGEWIKEEELKKLKEEGKF